MDRAVHLLCGNICTYSTTTNVTCVLDHSKVGMASETPFAVSAKASQLVESETIGPFILPPAQCQVALQKFTYPSFTHL